MTSKTPRLIVAAIALAAVSFTIGSATSSSAFTSATNSSSWGAVSTGDTWLSIAQQLVPGASLTDQTTYAQLLARENDSHGNTDSASTAPAVGFRFHYEPVEFPANSTTTSHP